MLPINHYGNSSDCHPETFQYFLGATQTSFEVKQKPSVTEVEMSQIAILLKMFKHFWVENL